MKILNTKTSDLTVGQSLALSLAIGAVTAVLCIAPFWAKEVADEVADKAKELKEKIFG